MLPTSKSIGIKWQLKPVLNSLKRTMESENNGEKTVDVLLVLTKDMANWIPSISKIGNWDIINGKPKF